MSAMTMPPTPRPPPTMPMPRRSSTLWLARWPPSFMSARVQFPYPAGPSIAREGLPQPLENPMIRTLASSLALALMLAGPALAQDKQQEPSKKQAAQQQRMKSCNAQASKKDLKGDERKAFMSECLKAESAKAKSKGKTTAQQQKMRSEER